MKYNELGPRAVGTLRRRRLHLIKPAREETQTEGRPNMRMFAWSFVRLQACDWVHSAAQHAQTNPLVEQYQGGNGDQGERAENDEFVDHAVKTNRIGHLYFWSIERFQPGFTLGALCEETATPEDPISDHVNDDIDHQDGNNERYCLQGLNPIGACLF